MPDKRIHNAGKALDDLYHLRTDILIRVIGNGGRKVSVLVHGNRELNRL